MQTNSDTVDIISGIGFPGLSIKGLISIGPEFALTGSMDASLSVSGEINAGLSVGFDKTTVFFPNTEAASEDSSEPGSDGDTAMSDYTPTYDVEASLDAAISAEGNLARMCIFLTLLLISILASAFILMQLLTNTHSPPHSRGQIWHLCIGWNAHGRIRDCRRN